MPAFAPQLRGFPAELGADVSPAIDVVFMEAPEQKELPMAARAMKETPPPAALKVKVVAPYRVVLDKPYVGGDVIEVPNDAERDRWLKAGWVELVKEK